MPDAPASSAARRSVRARRKAREAKAARKGQIMSLLNRGVSVAEIAESSGVSIGHMRNLVRKILAERAPAPPAEYLALQVSRLNEALLVSYGALRNSLTGTNFDAVDRVVRIVRELDRYHGFAPVAHPRRAPETRPDELEPGRLPPPSGSPIAIGPPEAPVLAEELSASAVAERIEIGAATD